MNSLASFTDGNNDQSEKYHERHREHYTNILFGYFHWNPKLIFRIFVNKIYVVQTLLDSSHKHFLLKYY